ncbi:hypothetical protein M9Y10_030651 [Tritrichomonas musculus]|uniref:Uncharacterized protein n=1 Tax=Tritrichomonas musculus TaxID=1915356 RepID=A0ABR2H2S6_9EUKA
MTLKQARILSSETDNTIKQEQNTNVNINIKPPQRCQTRSNSIPLYPNPQPTNPNINFTQVSQPMDTQQVGQISDSPMMNQDSQSQSQQQTNNSYPLMQDRGISDLGIELDTLDKKNQFLEMIVEMYETNPLKINSYVVCKSSLLMNMIKLLTECEKVDLVIDDSDIGCGCGASRTSSRPKVSTKILKIDKTLVTKDGKTEELKYCYNNIYTEFIKYNISLKLTY